MCQSDDAECVEICMDGDASRLSDALAAGLDPNQPLRYSNSPAEVAAARGQTECLRLLLDAGASPDGVRPLTLAAEPPLVGAAINRHPETVRLLLERGADPNCRSSAGHSPLRAMLRVCLPSDGLETVWQLLADAGADTRALDSWKKSRDINRREAAARMEAAMAEAERRRWPRIKPARGARRERRAAATAEA